MLWEIIKTTDVRCRLLTFHCINSAIVLLPKTPTVPPYVYTLKTQVLCTAVRNETSLCTEAKKLFHKLICALPFDREFAAKIEFSSPGKVPACPRKKKR
jgi:hypothetical protein